MRRVAVTGMAGITALGNDWPTIEAAFRDQRTGVRAMVPEWDRFTGINTRLAAPVLGFVAPDHWPRKKTRTMGRVATMAVAASEAALADAGLLGHAVVTSGRTGAAYGSSFGSPDAVLGFFELKMNGTSRNLNATTYIQMMSHTALVNIGLFFGITGRMIPTSSACTSGSQAIGYAAEAIRMGKADVMIAGGAEELDITDSAVFDTLFATSTKNDTPQQAPRPYDRDRDGLVIGEGAATLILEEWERAKARGAVIHAELVGFGTNSDGNHVTQPQAETMEVALRLALEDAGLAPDAIALVNGHGTATEWGDIAESQATAKVFGPRIPIHSLKSYFGHSLGACGSMEAWLGINMMKDGWVCPTANLVSVDERCAPLDYVMGEGRTMAVEHFMSNNFAFGGINTSLIFRRV
ncbi:beta-ketoacyl-ACP synthase II [Paramagnetospirillum kuznetsovii]|uniref:Beta-ketoacyl-ACP synthase II n=1 Tax=Paramagnetospirillum kuznetsovii TaxID=2053833 RepID=A0A364NUR8_9PROT|nr:beta-ketoacyl-ACP synthase [Paramagnetospirillum kuznetsovii]RAU20824.1 beta-ketoacyl-ACP synthase II [Paramagnetospirillum kuznetsovii]